ncbi:MAG: formylglycine-generating enzyme family protein, partial [Thermoguttaceae bacterium]|nr:formylglycine-generating enzyme family protein [Thermoguttaceae bacterium]
ACRATTTGPYFWGSSLNGDKANCDGNYPCGTSTKGRYLDRTTEVGSYDPNRWGLYDMHGNVWEWCEDWYDIDYYEKTNNARNPVNVTTGSYRVLRGGSWSDYAKDCRSARRYSNDPTDRHNYYGFRLALVRSSSSR